jgi:type IV secretory pathway TraG/TraD family ATPase VirD4
MTTQDRAKYIVIAGGIVLLLIVLEIVFIGELFSPPNMFDMPGWQTLYTTVVILLACGIVGCIGWVWYLIRYAHQLGTYGTAHFASLRELRQGSVTKQPLQKQSPRFRLNLPKHITRTLFVVIPLTFVCIAWLWGAFVAIGVLVPILLLVVPGSYLIFHEPSKSQKSKDALSGLSQVGESVASPPEESTFSLGTAHGTEIFLLEEQQEGHVLIVAPTKRGKTAGIIIPNLLAEHGSRSLLINDVKHELIDKCIGAVAHYHDCYVFAPTRTAESTRYNPLAHVSPESLSDARNVAECIVRNTGSSKEPFWDNAARLLLTAAVLHLRATEPEAPFSRLADICTKSLAEVSELIASSPSPLARRIGTSFVKNIAAEQRLQSNIMTDVATRLFDVMDPQIEAVTSYDELDFRQLGEKPSALFLHIPPHEASRLRWLSSCLIMQLINYLFEHPHKQRFAFYLDELANVGYIPSYLEYISYIRSAGIAFLQVIQDFGQLERIYEGHGKETILANSGTKVFLSGVGQVEAEYASRVMGETTVLARSENNQEGKTTTTYSETARKLMNPDEIRSLPMWSLLVFVGNMSPIITRCLPYFETPKLQALVNLPYTLPEHPLPQMPPINLLPGEPFQLPLSPQSPAPERPPRPQKRDEDEYFLEGDMPLDEEV